jgi:hypothetical protein
MSGKNAPDIARVPNLLTPYLQILKRNTLAVKHSINIVVGLNKQPRRIGEWEIVGKPACLGMTVWTDDGKRTDGCVESSGDGAGVRVGREKPVIMK